MKYLHRSGVLFSLLAVILTLAPLVTAQEEKDPRPAILIIGDNSSMSHRGAPTWVQLLKMQHPQWRIILDAKSKRVFGKTVKQDRMRKGKKVGEIVYPSLNEELPGILEKAGPVNLVFLMVGTEMGREIIHQDLDPVEAAKAIEDVVKKLKTHPNLKAAKIVLATPVPVMDVRLDQWSKEAFKGGEEMVKGLQEFMVQMAPRWGVELVDVYQMVWDDKDGDKPARLLGSGGWYLRGWGHPILGKMLEKEFVRLDPQPSDAAAYQAWKEEQAEIKKLNQVLIETGGGIVAHGPALTKVEPKSEAAAEDTGKKKKKKKKKGKYSGHHFTLSIEALQGGSLSVVAKAEDGKLFSIVSPNSPDKAKFPTLQVTLKSGEVIKLNPVATEMKILMEATPDRNIPNDFFGANIGKWRPYPMLSSEAGQRTWLLMRWSLEPLQGKDIQSAEVIVHDSGRGGYTQMLSNGGAGARPSLKAGFGGPQVFVILGPDDEWSLIDATWNSKRGKEKWSGGEVDMKAREDALKKLSAALKSAKVKKVIEVKLLHMGVK